MASEFDKRSCICKQVADCIENDNPLGEQTPTNYDLICCYRKGLLYKTRFIQFAGSRSWIETRKIVLER